MSLLMTDLVLLEARPHAAEQENERHGDRGVRYGHCMLMALETGENGLQIHKIVEVVSRERIISKK